MATSGPVPLVSQVQQRKPQTYTPSPWGDFFLHHIPCTPSQVHAPYATKLIKHVIWLSSHRCRKRCQDRQHFVLFCMTAKILGYICNWSMCRDRLLSRVWLIDWIYPNKPNPPIGYKFMVICCLYCLSELVPPMQENSSSAWFTGYVYIERFWTFASGQNHWTLASPVNAILVPMSIYKMVQCFSKNILRNNMINKHLSIYKRI